MHKISKIIITHYSLSLCDWNKVLHRLYNLIVIFDPAKKIDRQIKKPTE